VKVIKLVQLVKFLFLFFISSFDVSVYRYLVNKDIDLRIAVCRGPISDVWRVYSEISINHAFQL